MTADTDLAEARSAFERLERWGGQRLVSDMAEIFASEVPRRLTELGVALEAGDRDGAVRAAHSIKSSAAQLGAIALSRAAAEAERIAETSDIAAARPLIGEMRDLLAQFTSWLRDDMHVSLTAP